MIDLKKAAALFICILLIAVSIPTYAFAKDDDGRIDLYQVFSNKDDIMKTEVGSRIYKWSMYLPDDSIVYKSDRANFFNMSTSTYKASIQLNVSKNEDKLTLEDMLYKMQNSSRMENYWIWGDKEYFVDIVTDGSGQKYIKVVKTAAYYDYYMVDEAAEEFSDYIENRIYIANNYIYDLTVQMTGEFYRGHQDMFDKLINSFKTSYDDNNAYIKELSDSVSTTREYKNTSYGWRITLSPYWKIDGAPNSRNQTFSPVYTDEELNMQENQEKDENKVEINEGITVSLVSSAAPGETASGWADREIEMLKGNLNSSVYEIVKNQPLKLNGAVAQNVVIRYKTITKNPYVVNNIYVLGNGYKYLVSATIKEDKYQDSSKRSSFDNMLGSFTLDSACLSKYLGKIVAADSIMDLDSQKELKTKKYDFTTKVTNGWDISGNYQYYYDKYYYSDVYYIGGNVSNQESVYAYEPISGININMSAGLNGNDIKSIISDAVQGYLKDDDIGVGIADVKIQSAEYNGAQIYRIEKEYNIDEINRFVGGDATKVYNLQNIQNIYRYIVKIGNDTYSETITIPVAKMTDKNTERIASLWANTMINKINYSTAVTQWEQHDLQEFDATKMAIQ